MSIRFKQLARRLKALQQLERMTAELQACRTFAEVYRIIAHFVQLLLPGIGGALFMRDNGTYDCAASWGKLQASKRKFALRECTALHRMKAHVVDDPHGLGCPHVLKARGSYLCLPLMWDGQALGILHLQTVSPENGLEAIARLKIWMAQKIASHCAQKLGQLHDRQALTEQAVRDPLTGLFNRRYMEESLRRELEMRGKRSVGLIMLDIDHFKRFNTRFTHSGGDALLQSFGGFLSRHVRRADVACRFGGEEFVLILPGVTLEAARRRAEEIRKDVHGLRVMYHDKPLGRIAVSLGVAASNEHGSSLEQLLEAATRALRRAKRSGRDRVSVMRMKLVS